MADLKIIVGSTVEDDAADFLDTWKRSAPNEYVAAQRLLTFQSWEGLSSVLTGERFRLLRYVHEHPELTINALAKALERHYSRVHADVTALEGAGLLQRIDGGLRAIADRITVEIRL